MSNEQQRLTSANLTVEAIVGKVKPVEDSTDQVPEVCRFSVRVMLGGGDCNWYAVSARGAAAVTAMSLSKGDRVRVGGYLMASAYQDQDGSPQPSLRIISESVEVLERVGDVPAADAQKSERERVKGMLQPVLSLVRHGNLPKETAQKLIRSMQVPEKAREAALKKVDELVAA